MTTRIGRKLLITIIICIVVAVGLVSAITIYSSDSNVDELMMSQAETGLSIISYRVTEEIKRASDMTSEFVYASTESISYEQTWSDESSTEFDFAAVYDADGSIVWQSDNYNLGDFRLSGVGASGYEGIVVDSRAGLTVQSVLPLSDGGAAVAGINMERDEWLDEIKEEITAEATLFMGTTCYATTLRDDSGERRKGADMPSYAVTEVIEGGREYIGNSVLNGENFYVYYRPFTDVNGKIAGAYLSCCSAEKADMLNLTMAVTAIIVAAVVIIISIIIISSLVVKSILRPLAEAKTLAADMNSGNLSAPVTELKLGNDEIGDFLKVLEETKQNLCSYVGDITGVLEAMADGDFTAHASVEYVGDFTRINKSFLKIEESLKEIIGSIGQSSGDVMMGSSQIAEGSKMLADGTTRQAAAIEELSATINEIANKVQHTADNAAEASNISKESTEKIKYQNGEVEHMLEAMDEIKQRSDEIQNIIKSIDDIAFQTNILALNAAVEAARAGEAGKGFAVVADEVRSLAAKSGEAAQQTGTLIGATIEAVDKGTEIANTTAEIMKAVTELSERTNTYVGDISTASEEQADAITQIKIGIEQISSVVQQNSATAQETAAACSVLNEQSASLEQQIGKLKV